MKLTQKLLIGAFGGLLPTLLLMYRLDYTDLLNTAEVGLVVGGCIKAMLAAGFGAVMVYVHRTEDSVYKLIQLGVAAPGLLSILVTDTRQPVEGTKTIPANPVAVVAPAPAPTQGLSALFFGTAMAQSAGEWDAVGNGIRQTDQGTSGSGLRVEQFTAPEEGFLTQVARGITGALPTERFYVVHSSHATEADAMDMARKLNARVYRGTDPDRPFNVVVAERVSLEKAQTMNSGLKTGTNTIVEVR